MPTKLFFSKSISLHLLQSSLMLLLVGCSGSGPRFDQAPVILITIDTLRSDRLQPYGATAFPTPAFQALAEDGVLFENAFSNVPMTLPSHATILTGKLPPNTGVRDNIGFFLDPKHQTLAEMFHTKGYKTAAVVSSMVLRHSTGINQGFDEYQDSFQSTGVDSVGVYAQRDGESSLRLAEDWLNKHSKNKFFLWVHLYDPHTPYDPPAAFMSAGTTPYDGEVRHVDHLLGNFLAYLKKQGLYEKSLIVVTSDHGEGLGEHGEEEHGLLLYREALQVPLILKLPGNEKRGERRPENVDLADIAPTIAQMVNEKWQGDGVDLFSRKGSDAGRNIYAESLNAELFYGWHASKSVVQQQWHYIRNDEDRLFDWHADPREQDNLFGEKPVPPTAIALLETFGEGEKGEASVSEEDKALLASLGYSGGFDFGDEIKALNEKQFMELFYKVSQTKSLVSQGLYREAEPLLNSILQKFPDIIDVRLMLGTVLTGLGHFEEAEKHYLESMARSPKNVSLMVGLVTAKLGLNQNADAANLARKAVALEPVLGAKLLIPTLTRFNLFPLASELARNLRSTNPDYSYAEFVFGVEAHATGQFENALSHFKKLKEAGASGLEPNDRADLAYFFGDSLGRLERLPEALQAMDEAIALKPNHVRARVAKSLILFSMNKPKDALASLDQWLEAYPTLENYARSADTLELVGLKQQATTLRTMMKKLPH